MSIIMSEISKQDIMDCMSQVKLDTIYTLRGDD